MGNPGGTAELARVLVEQVQRMQPVERMADFGTIGKTMWLRLDSMADKPMQPGEYRKLESVGELKSGDKVAAILIGDYPTVEPLIIGKLEDD